MLDHRRREKKVRKRDGEKNVCFFEIILFFCSFLDDQKADQNQDRVHLHVRAKKNIQADMNIAIEKIEIEIMTAIVKKKNVVEIKFFVIVVYFHK
jgi:hypothetical protein